jgi:hypothetical protein
MNDDLWKIRKEAVAANFNVVVHLPGRTKRNMKTLGQNSTIGAAAQWIQTFRFHLLFYSEMYRVRQKHLTVFEMK